MLKLSLINNDTYFTENWHVKFIIKHKDMSIIRIEKDARFKGGTGVPSMPFQYEDIVTSVYLFGLKVYSYTRKTNLRRIDLGASQE